MVDAEAHDFLEQKPRQGPAGFIIHQLLEAPPKGSKGPTLVAPGAPPCPHSDHKRKILSCSQQERKGTVLKYAGAFFLAEQGLPDLTGLIRA
jgi:hypothetical protein